MRKIWLALTLLPVVGGAVAFSCSSNDQGKVVVKQITTRADLIGGPGALGEVGDYLLANDQARFIIQGAGFSRGFGLYGGSLIDADLVRPQSYGDSAGGFGRDNFSELFPGLFLIAMKPRRIELSESEGCGVITVTGSPADFVFLAQKINDVLVQADRLSFRNEYRLCAGQRYVEITTTITNTGDQPVRFPDPGVQSLLGDVPFIFPVGDVILFGAGNDVFAEGAGFDMRFTLERLYKQPVALPKLPGLVTPFIASRGPGISYGFMSGVTDSEASLLSRAGYDAPVDNLVIPFIASAFTGAYYGAAPEALESRRSFTFKKYFIVGSGDVASVRDVVHQIRGHETGQVAGVVRERFTQVAEAEVDVIILDAEGKPYNQHTTDTQGYFKGNLLPGRYAYRIVADGRVPTQAIPFEIVAGQSTFLEIELDSPGEVSVRVRQSDGQLMPGRCNLVASYGFAASGFEGRDFLYELALGERWRSLDLIPDTADPSTRRYIEETIMAPEGIASTKIRPGKYRAYCSRGLEYSLFEQDIEVRPREITTIDAVLDRVVDTRGWASGDYHLHSINSVDSFMGLHDRVAQVAVEGVDVACSSDHNFVTDYTRAISDQGLEKWLQGMVGLEMTTLETGHFNGFPLRYNPGPITKGSFEWSGRPPDEIFADIRALGSLGPDNTVIQVNHPRDTILGYFNDYNFNPDTGEAEDADSVLLNPECTEENPDCEFGKDKFSFDFDALEIYNGKRFELLRHYQVPERLPPPPLPEVIPPAGTVLRDSNGKVAYPGGMDDWFTLLDQGKIYTAMGNSDTHGLDDEAGIPRTYLPVSDDRPGGISEIELVRGIKNQRAFLTSGPFSTISVTGAACYDRRSGASKSGACGMGDVVTPQANSVTVEVNTQTAPWIQIDEVRFIVNGTTVATVPGDRLSLQKVTRQLEVPPGRDGWLVVEVAGEQNMFPVIMPREIPSIQVSDAIGSIAGAFGFNFSPFGNLQPSQVTPAKPYAFSNPIFIDTNGNGQYDPPGRVQALRAAAQAPRSSAIRTDPRVVPSLAKIFALFDCGH